MKSIRLMTILLLASSLFIPVAAGHGRHGGAHGD